MASIVIHPDNFADILIAYLLDNCIHEDKIPKEQVEMKKLIAKINNVGLRPFLLQQYLESDANIRYKYKMIRPALEGRITTQQSITLNKKSKALKRS